MEHFIDTTKPIWMGPVAFFQGMCYSLQSQKIRATYKRFFLHFIIVTTVRYISSFATIATILPILLLILSKPILGTLFFILVSTVACFVGFKAWAYYVGFKVEFSLLGMEECYCHDSNTNPSIIKAKVEKIRREYKVPKSSRQLKIITFNFIFGIITRLIVFIMGIGVAINRSNNDITTFLEEAFMWTAIDWSNNDVTNFLAKAAIMGFATGCQFISIYTLHLQHMSIRNHLKWCFQHALELIGFCLPLQLLEHCFTSASTLLCLGIRQAVCAPLEEDLTLETDLVEQQALVQTGFCHALELLEDIFKSASALLCLGIGQAACAPLVKYLMLESDLMAGID
jgi:hypothetical protein